MSNICPKCGREYVGRPALSRVDGKTDICPDCGMREALDAWRKSVLTEGKGDYSEQRKA